MAQTFLVRNVAKISRQEGEELDRVMAAIGERWRLTPVYNRGDDPLITSDHPCLFFALGEQLGFVFLPATPRLGLLVYDQTVARVSANNASQQDAAILNTLQVMVCQREVYSAEDLRSEVGEGRPLTSFFDERHVDRGWAADTQWSPEFITYPQPWMATGLSFIETESTT
jgi:hypothetical protein